MVKMSSVGFWKFPLQHHRATSTCAESLVLFIYKKNLPQQGVVTNSLPFLILCCVSVSIVPEDKQSGVALQKDAVIMLHRVC